jgi:hypothetical protein
MLRAPSKPLLVPVYVAAMRALGAVCVLCAIAVAPLLGLALAAPFFAVGIVSLVSAQGISERWLVGSAVCIGASLGELAFGGLLLRADVTMWAWALPLALVALLTSVILLDREVRAWLGPRVAHFEVVSVT